MRRCALARCLRAASLVHDDELMERRPTLAPERERRNEAKRPESSSCPNAMFGEKGEYFARFLAGFSFSPK